MQSQENSLGTTGVGWGKVLLQTNISQLFYTCRPMKIRVLFHRLFHCVFILNILFLSSGAPCANQLSGKFLQLAAGPWTHSWNQSICCAGRSLKWLFGPFPPQANYRNCEKPMFTTVLLNNHCCYFWANTWERESLGGSSGRRLHSMQFSPNQLREAVSMAFPS